MEKIITDCKNAMDQRLKTFETELTRIRTGRASISIIDGVKVNYYGSMAPLSQVANMSTPDARTIIIAPFEKSLIQEIEKSIMKADLGLQPTNDGHVVRIPIPQLTEDRRKDIVKGLKKIGEEAKVSLRHIRRDINEDIKKLEKDKKINEDDRKRLEGDVQKQTDNYCKLVDERLAKKEKEVMTI